MKFKDIIFKYGRLVMAGFISLEAFYLRINCLAHRELWNDEIFQLAQSSGPFKAIWQRHNYGDMTCFPGDYFLTYPFIKVFGINKWGLAIPHMLATAVGLYFLFLLCQRYFKTIIGDIVAFSIVCFNQHLIFHSFELRPYAVLPTLALMAMYFVDILISDYKKLSCLQRNLIGIFMILTIWFHAFGILIIFFALTYFTLVQKNNPTFKQYSASLVKFLGGVFVIALPIWFWYATGNPHQFDEAAYKTMGIQTFQYISNPLDGFWRFFNYTVFYHLVGFKNFYFLLGAMAFMLFIPYKEKLKKIAFFLTLVVLPIEVILFSDLVNGYWFLIRQYIYLTPVLALFLGWLWDSSVEYYLDKQTRIFNIRSVIGLILLAICTIAGVVGIIF